MISETLFLNIAVLQVQAEENFERPPKRARKRGGLRTRGVRTRGWCQLAKVPSTEHTDSDQAKTTSKAERKKKEKELEQALWKDEPNEVSQFPFNETAGLKINMTSKQKMDFFNLFSYRENAWIDGCWDQQVCWPGDWQTPPIKKKFQI